MNKIVNKIINNYKDCNDLIYKKIHIKLNTYHILFLETLCSSDKINEYILNGISFNNTIKNIKKNIPSPNTKKIKYDEINTYLFNGYTIIINKNKIIASETKANISRSITEPTTEPSVYGPKDAFTENIQNNLGLIKRRLKTNKLKNIVKILGKNKTIINILYLENITDKKLIKYIEEKIETNNYIFDSSNIKNIIDNNKNTFPIVKTTERPDTVCYSLTNGKVVILTDNSPFALITPAYLLDFLNPISDNYSKPININFIKIIRLLSFFLSIITPAFYIAITTYNQETIPLPLLLNITSQRQGVPFPAIIEAIFMIIVCEILKESDLRFPNNYGSAISILGALILGEAAVSAGIVSPIMIIIIAITYITSLLFTDVDLSGSIRLWRFIFLILSVFYGLYGVCLSIIALLINLISYKAIYTNYTYPIIPSNKKYLFKTLLEKNNK